MRVNKSHLKETSFSSQYRHGYSLISGICSREMVSIETGDSGISEMVEEEMMNLDKRIPVT